MDRAVALAYGACDTTDAPYPRRITYLIAEDGRILRAIETKDPGRQAEELLQVP